MSQKLPPVTGERMIRFLKSRGFSRLGRTGSHVRMSKDGLKRPVVVPVHGSKELKIGVVMNCLNTAEISRSDFVDYFHKGKSGGKKMTIFRQKFAPNGKIRL